MTVEPKIFVDGKVFINRDEDTLWNFLNINSENIIDAWPDHPNADAVYIVGIDLLINFQNKIKTWVTQYSGKVLVAFFTEGSNTMLPTITGILNLVRSKKIVIAHAGQNILGPPHIPTDIYFSEMVRNHENICAHQTYNVAYETPNKPYWFNFLNGALRPHRKYLIDRFRSLGILDNVLYSILSNTMFGDKTNKIIENIILLPPEYEPEVNGVKLLDKNCKQEVKHQLWGLGRKNDSICLPKVYHDSYFSVVAETTFNYPCSLPSEKIFKPIIMCHPFVVVANYGYYRDLHRIGFRTFGNLIDETFDLIEDPQTRLEKVVAVICDICKNGPNDFLIASKSICEYNYERMKEYNQEQRIELQTRISHFVNGTCQ